MSQEINYTKVSKFLSYVLRHKPETINLTLDENGWTSVTELIDKSQSQIELTPAIIQQVVHTNDKNRFALSNDQQFIRANQGHSISVDLKLSPEAPPDLLYHGTATQFLNSIRQEGLKPGQRHHVHLSLDQETAIAVGKRHGTPIVLEVAACTMYHKGYEFFLSENNIWLTAKAPSEFLTVIS